MKCDRTKRFCTCGECVRCGHCNLRREVFITKESYQEHIRLCPSKPKTHEYIQPTNH